MLEPLRARDLKVGDKFRHRSGIKLPSILTVASVVHTKRQILIRPVEFKDYEFHFTPEQKV